MTYERICSFNAERKTKRHISSGIFVRRGRESKTKRHIDDHCP